MSIRVQFEPNISCNANCVFCPRNDMTRKRGEMSDELFHKIIKDGKELNASFFLPFLNGEPFIFSRIWKWLDYMRDEGVQVALYTNAEYIDVERIVKYPNIRYINCSINGATKETYNKAMLGPDFDRVESNVKELIAKAKFKVKVSMVVNDDTINEIDLFKKKWGNNTHIRSFKNWGGDRKSAGEKEEIKKPCWSLMNSINIFWDGRVTTCCMNYDDKLILGDVNKNTLREIWDSARWLRKRHRKLDFNMIPCKTCNYNGTIMPKKNDTTILYYSANTENPKLEAKVIENIKKQAGDMQIISITRKPTKLGTNICIGETNVCYSNSFRQILIGLKAAKTRFCIATESDTLYPPEYFNFTPKEEDRVYRYNNLYVHFDGRDKFWKKRSVEGAQMAGREYWIKCIEEAIDTSTWEPQKVNPPFVFPLTGEGTWSGENPVCVLKTREGIGFKTGFIAGSVTDIKFWGTAKEVREKYLE